MEIAARAKIDFTNRLQNVPFQFITAGAGEGERRRGRVRSLITPGYRGKSKGGNEEEEEEEEEDKAHSS